MPGKHFSSTFNWVLIFTPTSTKANSAYSKEFKIPQLIQTTNRCDLRIAIYLRSKQIKHKLDVWLIKDEPQDVEAKETDWNQATLSNDCIATTTQWNWGTNLASTKALFTLIDSNADSTNMLSGNVISLLCESWNDAIKEKFDAGKLSHVKPR